MAKEKFDRSKPHVNIGTIRYDDLRQDDADGGDHQDAVQAQSEE